MAPLPALAHWNIDDKKTTENLSAKEILRREIMRQSTYEATRFNATLQYSRSDTKKDSAIHCMKQAHERDKLSNNFSSNFLHC
jgi:hypothetical protein